MAPPSNESFEDAGASPGLALAWSTTIVSNGWELADFSGGGGLAPNPTETFTGSTWATVPFDPLVVLAAPASFDQGKAPVANTTETFRYWFANNFYRREVNQFEDAAIAPGGGPNEGFEAWTGDPYLTELTLADVGVAFDESFDQMGWAGEVLGPIGTLFDQGTQSIEDFEEVFTDLLYVVDELTNVFTAIDPQTFLPVPHTLTLNQKVTTGTNGTRPSGLTFGRHYYVINPGGLGSTTFQLSQTLGGAAVDVASQGVGAQWVHADETKYWTNPVGAVL